MMNRREALTRLGGYMALGLFGSKVSAQTSVSETLSSATASAVIPAGKPFTIAHITDVHLTPNRDAQAWFAKCLHTIQSHPSNPGLILNTGDSVMETLGADRATADGLWKLWRDSIQNENSLPIHHVLGNHDVWGLARKKDAAAKLDSMYGKKLGLNGLNIEKSYYSFDQGGWHFVGLDSVLPFESAESGWTGGLDDEQFHWLEQDLRATPADRPVFVYCHIPILQVASFKSLRPNEKNAYSLSPGIMLGDARRIIDLFERHPNVKVCVSGHLHLQDRVELTGVTYICAGAVSGAWWKGTHVDSPPGYSLFHLNPDGTFKHEYQTYGWAGKPEDAKG